MSRIGKQPVTLAQGVTVTINGDNAITVKGPKGTLTQSIDRDIKLKLKITRYLLPGLPIKSVIVQCMVFTDLWCLIWLKAFLKGLPNDLNWLV